MNEIVHALMRKRQMPKNQLCPKHGIPLTDHLPGGSTFMPLQVRLRDRRRRKRKPKHDRPNKICIECAKEKNDKA